MIPHRLVGLGLLVVVFFTACSTPTSRAGNTDAGGAAGAVGAAGAAGAAGADGADGGAGADGADGADGAVGPIGADDGAGSEPWTWVETFDTLDPSRWQVEFSSYGDPLSEHCYHPDNVTVADGALHLTARAGMTRCRYGKEWPYSSGMVRTLGLVDWTYGEFEIDARFPAGAGLWPALWLSPTTKTFGPWPHSGEIDIAEALGHEPDRTVCSVHFWSEELDRHDKSVGSIATPGRPDGMRTYGLRWTAEELVWSVDGRECHRASVADLGRAGVFDQPFHLKINLAIGGAWPGPADPTAFPAVLTVDEIRVRSPAS